MIGSVSWKNLCWDVVCYYRKLLDEVFVVFWCCFIHIWRKRSWMCFSFSYRLPLRNQSKNMLAVYLLVSWRISTESVIFFLIPNWQNMKELPFNKWLQLVCVPECCWVQSYAAKKVSFHFILKKKKIQAAHSSWNILVLVVGEDFLWSE